MVSSMYKWLGYGSLVDANWLDRLYVMQRFKQYGASLDAET